MRLAVLSDIHGNWPALQAVWAELQAEGVDQVINLGDIASGPLWPAETVAWLMTQTGWLTIRGNHERQLQGDRARMGASDAAAFDRLDDAQRAWLATLPAEAWIGDDVRLVHGTPLSDLDYLMETVTPDFGAAGSTGIRAARADEVRARLDAPRPSLLLCGHTHVPRVVQLDGTLVVNPGSVGLPAYDDARPHPHWVETGSSHARWALVVRNAKGLRVEQRITPYNWELAAQRAENNGRGDWADALRSGRVGRTEAEIMAALTGSAASA